jgi:hypothetical protein
MNLSMDRGCAKSWLYMGNAIVDVEWPIFPRTTRPRRLSMAAVLRPEMAAWSPFTPSFTP